MNGAEAQAWLATALAGGPVASGEVAARAEAAGIRPKTLRNAASALGVVKVKIGAPGSPDQCWTWRLPAPAGTVSEAERSRLRDAALELLGGLVIDDGRRWGDAAVDVQWEDARAVLDVAGETPYHWLGRSRGYDKTAGVAGVCVAAMLTQAPRGARLYGLAADRDQGALLIDSVSGYVSRTPELAGALTVDAFKVSAARAGATLEVLAADAPSSYGLRPWFLAVDELSVWSDTDGPRRLFDATTSALAKVPGARCVIITSAGSPSHFSHRVRGHAFADPLWRVSEQAGPPPWVDPGRLAEQRRRLLPSVYARLFENVWSEAEDALATRDDVLACVGHAGDLEPDVSHRYVAALDVGLVNDRCVAAVAHAEDRPAGRTVVVDRLAVWQGRRSAPVDLSAVEAWLAEACNAYRCDLVYDPFQAAHLTQRLKKAGVRVEAFTFSSASVGKLASTLYALLRDRCLDLPDDGPLVDELCSVRLRETVPGVVRLDHSASGHDDMAVTVAMAAANLVDRPAASAEVHTNTIAQLGRSGLVPGRGEMIGGEGRRRDGGAVLWPRTGGM